MDFLDELEHVLAMVPLRQNHQPDYRAQAQAVQDYLMTTTAEIFSNAMIKSAAHVIRDMVTDPERIRKVLDDARTAPS